MGGGERRGSRLLLPAVSAIALLLCSPLGLPRQDYRITRPARCASERGGAGRFWAGLECAPANCSPPRPRAAAGAGPTMRGALAPSILADQSTVLASHPGLSAFDACPVADQPPIAEQRSSAAARGAGRGAIGRVLPRVMILATALGPIRIPQAEPAQPSRIHVMGRESSAENFAGWRSRTVVRTARIVPSSRYWLTLHVQSSVVLVILLLLQVLGQ
eukprot:COSAG01_NODE_11651_length_1887_cov_4.770134_2_plen_217_part_00